MPPFRDDSHRISQNLLNPAQPTLLGLASAMFLLLVETSTALPEENPSMRAVAVKSYADLMRQAEGLAGAEYQPPPPLPEGISNLSYDDYRMIAFRHERAIWFEQPKPFWLEMFHRGFVHKNKIELFLISEDREQEIPFSADLFEYRGPLADVEVPEDTGYAGLRIVGSFPGRTDRQEMLTFLGASYFRALVNSGVYGASCRGLAVDIATNGPEEFPAFRQFWVVEPQPGDKELKVLALLDGPRVTGAYQFVFHPQKKQTDIDVRAKLYFRKDIQKLGIAPLTSMWMWGDAMAPPPLDHRPEVHDSDGLLIKTKEDWTYRVLSRQSYPSVSAFTLNEVEGFGLLQREMSYSRYRDDEAKYHLRPSVWVQPKTPLKNGRIELLELPGVHEGIDNIGAYWVPQEPVRKGGTLELDYRISYFSGNLPEHSWLGKVTETEINRREDRTIQFTVTFEGKALSQLAKETPLNLEVSPIRAQVLSTKVRVQPEGARVAEILVKPEGDGPVEIKAHLMDANRKVTETWSYLCAVTPPKYKYPQVYTRIE